MATIQASGRIINSKRNSKIRSIFDGLSVYNIAANWSKKWMVSVGPGMASGWNWQEKKGFVLCLMPSTLPSLALRSQTFQSFGRVFSSTAKPWFWLVM